jgi:uncharacterized membrane protein
MFKVNYPLSKSLETVKDTANRKSLRIKNRIISGAQCAFYMLNIFSLTSKNLLKHNGI